MESLHIGGKIDHPLRAACGIPKFQRRHRSWCYTPWIPFQGHTLNLYKDRRVDIPPTIKRAPNLGLHWDEHPSRFHPQFGYDTNLTYALTGYVNTNVLALYKVKLPIAKVALYLVALLLLRPKALAISLFGVPRDHWYSTLALPGIGGVSAKCALYFDSGWSWRWPHPRWEAVRTDPYSLRRLCPQCPYVVRQISLPPLISTCVQALRSGSSSLILARTGSIEGNHMLALDSLLFKLVNTGPDSQMIPGGCGRWCSWPGVSLCIPEPANNSLWFHVKRFRHGSSITS